MTAALGALGPRGLPIGVWVIISSFIFNAKFSMAAPMYWSSSWPGGLLVVLALGALAAAGRAAR